jgi:hypothetical protein
MREWLLAELDARITRHVDGDSSGVVDDNVLGIVAELARSGAPDAGSLTRVAALHLCRHEALPPGRGDTDLRVARAIYTTLHAVDPRLVPPGVRDFLGLAAPHEQGVALLREYDRTGALEHLDRAISLFRQDVLEGRPDGAFHLATALARRSARTGQPADREEAVRLGRTALAAVPVDHPARAELLALLDRAGAHPT